MRVATIFLLQIAHLSSVVLCQDAAGSSKRAKFSGKSARVALEKLFGNESSPEPTFEAILFKVLPILLNQKPFDADGRFEENRAYLVADTSNDEIAFSTTEEVIRRSGFEVERHSVTSDDGYITRLYNLINPLADRTQLKQPPVMVMHGGTIDPTFYVSASAIQHYPEKYPRLPEDGPITSWNRSLAFTLANNGYDVWLVSTRGCNADNRERTASNVTASSSNGLGLPSPKDSKYFHYSFDELINYEFPRQVDRILELTGSTNLSLFTYSFSGLISLCSLGQRPDIAKNKIHTYMAMAPVLNLDSSNTVFKLVCKLVPQVNIDLGNLILRALLSPATRKLFVSVGKSRELRYTLVKFVMSVIYGSSGKYRTNLEPPILGHQVMPISFKQLQHFCQNANARQYRKFDNRPVKNQLVYGQSSPPIYNISDIHVKNWMLLSGTNDNLSPTSNIEQLLEIVNPKPMEHLRVRGFSHLDLTAAVDIDVHVVLPVVEFLNKFALESNTQCQDDETVV